MDSRIAEVVRALQGSNRLLLQASPGTGKTTRVPPALMGLGPGQVWVLEPRRLAAKWAAHRVAGELGETGGPGGLVGYQFRFEKRESARTRIQFITEGILLRRLAQDSLLREASVVVLDEFHERHLTTDLALTCLLEVQKRRPDLKIVVMSATLDISGLKPLMDASGSGSTPVIEVEAPRHPVEIRHLKSPPEKRIEDLVASHARTLLEETRGDLLVFLPGMREMRRVESALQNTPAKTLLLHGDLSREEQDSVMQPGSLRRIILSTNLAESSVTIPGITGVIDSGLHRIASHSAWSGVSALRTRPISKASAIQRAGRAGRTGPGICQRLFTASDFEGRPAFEVPEIRRADLAQVILDLREVGVPAEGRSLSDLSWLDFPELSQWEAGARLLWLLGYLEAPSLSARLSRLGEAASRLSMHPRISRLLLEAVRAGRLPEWLDFAVELAEGAPSDLASRQWRRELDGISEQIQNRIPGKPAPDLARALLRAFPDRVVRTQGPNVLSATAGMMELSRELAEPLKVAGTRVTAVALEAQERQSRELGAGGSGKSAPVIERWMPIEEDWLLDLEPSLIQELEKPIFDERQKRVLWSSMLSYGALALAEELREPRTAEEWKQAESILLRTAWKTELPSGSITLASAQSFVSALRNQGAADPAEVLETLFARLLLISEHRLLPGELPSFRDLLAGAIEGRLSLRELDEVDWEAQTSSALVELCPGLRLRDWTPTSILLPGPPQGARPGPRNAKIHYRLGHAPWVESRLQDFWGLKATPTILAGRLALTLHLLAPNQRAVQVTKDLPGFWERAYPEIRKELSRNYPRHFWP
jgi:ATP-dependent helicase HrpB